MKRRIRKITNFFAFNLLFFALYLNFIHKDNGPETGVVNVTSQQTTAAFSATVLTEHPAEQNKASIAGQPTVQQVKQGRTALRLSIN